MPEPTIPAGNRKVEEEPDYIPASISEEPYWCFSWADVMPDRIAFHQPLLSVEVKEGKKWKALEKGGVPVDDQEYGLAVIYRGETDVSGMGRYEARWLVPETEKGREYRFRIEARDPFKVMYSPVFTG